MLYRFLNRKKDHIFFSNYIFSLVFSIIWIKSITFKTNIGRKPTTGKIKQGQNEIDVYFGIKSTRNHNYVQWIHICGIWMWYLAWLYIYIYTRWKIIGQQKKPDWNCQQYSSLNCAELVHAPIKNQIRVWLPVFDTGCPRD